MSFAKKIRQWRDFRNAVQELSALDDAALAELGITRGEIRYMARKATGF